MYGNRDLIVGEDEVVYGDELDLVGKKTPIETIPYYGIAGQGWEKMAAAAEKIGFKEPLSDDYDDFFQRYSTNDKMAEFMEK